MGGFIEEKRDKHHRKKHKRNSIRLKYYDYGSEGLYFITICCKHKNHYFGEIVNGEMRLNDVGEVVRQEWLNSENVRKNVILHEFVVMPNHFHAIIEMTENLNPYAVGANCNLPLQNQRPKLNGTSNTVGPIVRGFKISVIKKIKLLNEKLGHNFFSTDIWQRNYYEHVIRNESSYFQIAEYIEYNPINWANDRFYS